MLEFAALAVFLGLKHSFDADHLLAVSNLLKGAGSLEAAARFSASWAAGHMLTATSITVLLFTFRESLLPLFSRFELVAALMLVALGLYGLCHSRIFHSHAHRHGGKKHEHLHVHLGKQESGHAHRHLFGVGVVHGLASNDELLMLLTVSLGVADLAGMIAGVAFFSLGVALGMIAFSLLFTYPLLKTSSEKLHRLVDAGVGSASVAYGLLLLRGA